MCRAANYTSTYFPFTLKYTYLKMKFLSLSLSLSLFRVFANVPGDLSSIPGRVIPMTLKMVLDTSLLNTQQYKVRI